MSEFDGMTTEELRKALRAYEQEKGAGPVTSPPTSAAEHADIKRFEAIMAKPAGQLSADEREFLSKGINAWRKTQ